MKIGKFNFQPISQRYWWRLGVSASSWILLVDSQKLSFSTLMMKPISVFWSDKPPRRPSLAQPAWSAKLSRQGRPSLGVDGHNPILKKIYIFEILMKKCTKYVSTSFFWQKKIQKWAPLMKIRKNTREYVLKHEFSDKWIHFIFILH